MTQSDKEWIQAMIKEAIVELVPPIVKDIVKQEVNPRLDQLTHDVNDLKQEVKLHTKLMKEHGWLD